MTRRNFLAIAVGAAFLGGAVSAHAQASEADFFKGKTIRMVVGFGSGGGYDIYARMIAPYIAQRLDAKVIVENTPGAGSMTAMNNIYAAEPDGLRMMLAHGTASGLAQLTDSPTVRFQLSNFSHLGTVGSNPYIWLVHKDTAEKTPADFIKSGRSINWAASGPLDGMSDGAQITCAGVKLTCKVVMGYKGSNDAALAVTRKEMDAVFVNDTSANNYVQSNDLRAVANMSRQPSQLFKNVPTIFESMKLSPEDEWLFDFHSTLHALGRILIAPPNIPAARLKFIREAVKEALSDPALIAEGEKSQREVSFTDAERTIEAVRRVINDLTPAQKEQVQRILSTK